MNTEIQSEVDAVSKLWPPQVFTNHEQWYNIWRGTQLGSVVSRSEDTYTQVGKRWAEFANGKDLNPRLIMDWHLHVLKFTNHTGQPITIERVKVYHTIIKKYLKWMKNVRLLANDPSVFMPELRTPAPLPSRSWTHTEYTTVACWLEARPQYAMYHWLWVLGYHTGMSLTDCCNLKWEEVTLRDDGPCMIQRMRDKVKRRVGARALCTVPVLPGGELWRFLKGLQAQAPIGAVFVHRDAPQFYAKQSRMMRHVFSMITREALGYTPKTSFRHLRNSFASRLINSGADSVMVAKMTGHTNPQQLAEYVIPDIRSMQDAILKALRWAEHNDDPIEPVPFLTFPPPSPVPAEASPQPRLLDPDTGAGEATSNNQ